MLAVPICWQHYETERPCSPCGPAIWTTQLTGEHHLSKVRVAHAYPNLDGENTESQLEPVERPGIGLSNDKESLLGLLRIDFLLDWCGSLHEEKVEHPMSLQRQSRCGSPSLF